MALSKCISWRTPTCDNAHSWQRYSAAPLGNQCTSSTMIWYPTQQHFPDIQLTSPSPILIMLSAWLGSNKYLFLSHWLDSTRVRTRGFEYRDLAQWRTDAQLWSILYKELVTEKEIWVKIQQAIGPPKEFLIIIWKKRQTAVISCSTFLLKAIFQCTVRNRRGHGRQRKRWEDNISL